MRVPPRHAQDEAVELLFSQRVGRSRNRQHFRACRVNKRFMKIKSRAPGSQATRTYYVLLGVRRPALAYDTDALRVDFVRNVEGSLQTFPIQRGTLIGDLATPSTAVSCTCKDWKFRGTDKATQPDKSVRSLPHRVMKFRRVVNGVRIGTVMGAIHGCKHMLVIQDAINRGVFVRRCRPTP